MRGGGGGGGGGGDRERGRGRERENNLEHDCITHYNILLSGAKSYQLFLEIQYTYECKLKKNGYCIFGT